MAHPHTLRRSPVHLSPLWRHFLQMLAVMLIGMVASAAVFLTIVGTDWNEATINHPVTSLVVIAAGMSVPMSAWMLRQRMGWKNAAEMAAVMVLPVLPFLCFVWFDVTKSAQCGGYCLISIAAMLGLVLYRRDVYST